MIVAVGLSNQAGDAPHLLPMVEQIKANTGQLPDKLIVDAGYCSTDNIEACEQRGVDAYFSTSRQEHGKRPQPPRGPAPRALDARGRMDRKIRSKAGQAIYALRKTIVEQVFGQIKGARGLDRFLLRGQEKVNGEWHLIATTHNILAIRYPCLVQFGLGCCGWWSSGATPHPLLLTSQEKPVQPSGPFDLTEYLFDDGLAQGIDRLAGFGADLAIHPPSASRALGAGPLVAWAVCHAPGGLWRSRHRSPAARRPRCCRCCSSPHQRSTCLEAGRCSP